MIGSQTACCFLRSKHGPDGALHFFVDPIWRPSILLKFGSFTQQLLIECLLCVSHSMPDAGGRVLSKTNMLFAFMWLIVERKYEQVNFTWPALFTEKRLRLSTLLMPIRKIRAILAINGLFPWKRGQL